MNWYDSHLLSVVTFLPAMMVFGSCHNPSPVNSILTRDKVESARGGRKKP